jgi:hypothetical protein
MRILPVLVLVTGCASATPAPSSPSEARPVCVDQAEQEAVLVDHWIAGCGKRKESEDPACHREHQALFDLLEVHDKGCPRIKRHTVAVGD